MENFKKNTRIYPLAQAANPPQQKFVNLSGKEFSTIHANDFHFYEEVAQLVQEEPADFLDPDTLGLLASIGIEKGKPFAPDERMRKILADSAAAPVDRVCAARQRFFALSQQLLGGGLSRWQS